MSQQIINVGNLPDNGDGDPLRTAFIKTNDNFTEIYAAGPVGSNIAIANNTISTSQLNGNIILGPKGIGVVQTNSSFMPRVDDVYDLGTPTLRFNTLYLGTGGFDTVGNIIGNYFIGNGSLLTGVVAQSPIALVSGNTTVAIQQANGNIIVNVRGTSNVMSITPSNVAVDATLSVSNAVYLSNNLELTNGNIQTNGTISATGNISGNYYQGNGYYLTGIITSVANINNGTSNVRIDTPGGNIYANVDGVANAFAITTAGVTAVGNITAPWFIGNVQGNIHGNYIVPGATTQILFNDGGYANASAGLTFNKTTNALTTTGTVNSASLYVTGDGLILGNFTVNGTTNYINVTNLTIQDPVVSIGRGANNSPLVNNDGKDRGEQLWYYTSSEKSAFIGYDNSAANLILATDVSITNEVVAVNNYGNVTVGNLSGQFVAVSANVNANNLIASSNISATGNVSGTYILGNGAFLTGIDTTLISSGTSNVRVTTPSGNIAANVGGTGNVWVLATTGEYVSGVISATGNVSGGNITTAGLISATGNITSGANIAGNFVAAGSNRQIMFNDNGLISSSALMTFDKAGPTLSLTNAAGTIITGYVSSLGGTDLSLTPGTSIVVSWANINPRFSNTYALGTSTFQWKNVWAGNANIGTLGVTSITATGNVTGGNLTTTGIGNIGTLEVTGTANIVGNTTVTANISGGNITTAGLISATGNITGGNLTTTGIANVGTLSVTGSGNVTGNLGVVGNVSSGNSISTLFNSINTNLSLPGPGNTAAERLRIYGFNNPAYTNYAIGTENGYIWTAVDTVSDSLGFKWYGGNVLAATLTSSGKFTAVSNITGGNLTTIGTANIGTLEVTGGISIVGNVTGNLNVTGNIAGGNITTPGLISATGNITGGNLTTTGIGNIGTLSVTGTAAITGNTTVTANISGGNITTAGLISATGNITGGNLTTTGIGNIGTLSVTGTAAITGNTTVTANISGGNIVTAGLVSATGNVTGGNLTTTGIGNIGTLAVTGTAAITGNTTVTANISGGNITTAGLISATGNITGGNLTTTGIGNIGTLAVTGTAAITGNTTVTANISGGNITTAGLITATGNVTGGNLTTTGIGNIGTLAVTGAATITGNATVTANIAGGNISTAGLISATGNVTGGNIVSNGIVSTNNVVGSLSNVTVTAGSYVTTFDNTGNVTFPGNTTATSNVIGGNLTTAGIANVGTLAVTGAATVVGNATVTANIAGGNITTAGLITATGNVTGGNLNTAGLISATGNITGGNLTTAGTANIGTLAVTGNGTITGNATVTANIAGGNITTAGLVAATGNVSGGNVITASRFGWTGVGANSRIINTGSISLIPDISYDSTSGIQIGGSGYLLGPNGSRNLTLNYNSENGVAGAYRLGVVGNQSEAITNYGTNATGSIGNATSYFGNAYVKNTWTEIIQASGNVTGGNLVTAGIANVTGNIYGNNIIAASNLEVLGNKITTGTTSGLLFEPGNVTLVSGNIVVNGGFIYSQNGDTAIILVNNGEIGSIGIQNNLQVGKDGLGNLDVAGYANLTGALTVGGVANVVGNIIGANITTAGLISATGNITGGNLISSGIITTTGNIDTTGNVNAANVVTANINGAGGAVTIAASTGNYTVYLIPSGTGTVDTNDARITNVGTPTQPDDAATKQYVDDAVSAGIHIHQAVQYEQGDALTATYANGGTSVTVDSISGTKTLTFTTSPALVVNSMIVFSSSFNGLLANTAYFIFSSNGSNQVTLSLSYGGVELTGLTNGGPGLAKSALVNSGVGATLTNSGANVAFTPTGTVTPATAGDRVLVYNQANAAINGVYSVTTVGAPNSPGPGVRWVLTRSVDSNQYAPQDPNGAGEGDYFYITSGSGAGESYVLTAPNGAIIFGQSNITYTLFSATQIYSGANGVAINGQVISANVDNDTTAISLGNIVIKAGANLTTPNIGAATGVSLTTTGNITANNIVANNYFSATFIDASANITGGNITSNGAASITGNVSAGNLSVTGFGNVTGNLHALGNAHFGQDLSFIATFANIQYAGTANSYLQLVAQNKDNGSAASTDFIATADNGTDADTFIDMGINSPAYNQPGYGLQQANDGYLYVAGNTATGGGNLVLSTLENNDIIFSTGGVDTGDEQGRFQYGNGFKVTGNIYSTGNVSGSWFIGNVFGNVSGNLTVTGPNTGVLFNDSGIANSTAGFTFDKTSNLATLTGNLSAANISTAGLIVATGNVTGGNIITGGLISATGNITATANIAGGNITATSNIAGGNITTAGLISATGNVTGGNLITLGIANVGILTVTGNATVTANVAGGNITTAGLISATGNVTGGNLTTTGIANVGTLSVTGSGNVTGNLGVTGNVSANYYSGNGYYLTGIITSVANINNGTSNVRIDASGGNILANVGGVANVFAITTVGANVDGTLGVTGNVTGSNLTTAGTANVGTLSVTGSGNVTGNLGVTGNIDASYYLGNGYYLTGIITSVANINNGTSNVRIDSSGGNILANVGGVANVFAITTVGANVDGTLGVTGNITGGNLTTTGIGNIGTLAVTGAATITGNTTVTANIAGGNITTAGLISATGNVTGGNITTTGLVSATGNVTGGNIDTAGLVSATGNVTGGNLTTTGIANVGTLSVTGSGNVTGNLGVTGNVSANYYSGNGYYLTGIITSVANINNGTSNLRIDTSGGNILANVGGTANVFAITPIGANVTGNLDATSNVSASYFLGNGSQLTGLLTSSISNGTSSVSIPVVNGNVNTSVGGTANVLVVTSAGANVTGNLGVSSNVSAAYFLGNANATSLTSGTVPSARLTGTYSIDISGLAARANTVTDAAQPNITSVGTLTSLTVTGNVSGGNLTTGGLISATGNITGGNISTAGLIKGTNQLIIDTGPTEGAQIVLAWNGISGLVGQANGTWNIDVDNSNSFRTFYQNASGQTATPFTIYSGNSLAQFSSNVSAGYYFGNGSQLTGITAAASPNIVNGTSNVSIPVANGNVNTSVGGTANVFVVTSTGANIAGTVNATGNITGGNLTTTGTANIGTLAVTGAATVTGNIAGGNVTTAGLISATGNITGGNLTTAGLITATGNITGGNLITSGSGGNITGANVVSATTFTATANVSGGNLTTTGIANVGTLLVTGDGLVQGNLTVNGTTNYINVTNLNIQDPIIGIGRGANNSPLVSNDSKDRGEQLWYYSGSEKSSFIGYDNSAGNLIAAVDVSITSEVVTVNSYGNFVVGTLAATTVNATSTVNATGNITGGNLTTAGNITGAFYFGNAYYMNGIASLSSVYNQFQVQGNTAGNSSGNVTINASTTSGVSYPRAGNGITMAGNATTGVITFSVSGSTNDGTFWSQNNSAGLVSASIDAPDVDNGLVTDATLSASYDLGVLEYTANAPFDAITSDVLPATPNAYVVGNSALSWKSMYSEGNITTNSGYFIGNGALLTGVLTSGGNLSNGNSNIAIVSSGGNIAFSVAANANVAVFGTGVAQVKGNIVPAANAAYNLGSATLQWNSLYVAGNTIYLGNISLKAGASNTLAVYGSDGTTPGAVVATGGFNYNSPNITTSGNVSNTYNAISGGPITVNNNITVTIDNGATWTIV